MTTVTLIGTAAAVPALTEADKNNICTNALHAVRESGMQVGQSTLEPVLLMVRGTWYKLAIDMDKKNEVTVYVCLENEDLPEITFTKKEG